MALHVALEPEADNQQKEVGKWQVEVVQRQKMADRMAEFHTFTRLHGEHELVVCLRLLVVQNHALYHHT